MIEQLSTILVFILLIAFLYKYWLCIIILFIALFIIVYLLC
jgi:hypothetical protein